MREGMVRTKPQGLGLASTYIRTGCVSTTSRARATQRQCPFASNLGQKNLFSDHSKEQLGVGFTSLGWTSAFYPGGVPAIRHVD